MRTDIFKKKLGKEYRIYFWIISFLITGAIIFFILPGEPQFKYEYQKGLPWKHQNLIAPFNYSVKKTEAELTEDRENALKEVAPYFVKDTSVFAHKMKMLVKDFKVEEEASNKLFFDRIKKSFKAVYDNGILISSPNSYKPLIDAEFITIEENNEQKEVKKEDILSEKTAYEQVDKAIADLVNRDPSYCTLFEIIPIENYIAYNLKYDEQKTEQLRKEKLEAVTDTKGMVQAGERIILQGEIVNDHKFQLLESLRTSFENERSKRYDKYALITGKVMLILLLLTLIFAFLYIYRYDIVIRPNQIIFLLFYTVFVIFLAILINTFPSLHIYLVPLAIYPIVIRTFFDSRTAIFLLMIVALIIAFYAPNGYEYFLIQTSGGIAAVLSLNKMQKRGHLLIAAIWVFLVNSFVYTALELIYNSSFDNIDYSMYKWFALSSVLIALVYLFVYIFEKVFGFVSDVTLIELSNSNQPLLRKLAELAPGTFQHSMQVANLAEAIIYRIGGNPFLTRAGALYHDIGKLNNPAYFIENQSPGMNPHDNISDVKSAEIIISHVTEGVRMAQKHNLPYKIIQFIVSHHGTTQVKYFYIQHCNECPNRAGKDIGLFTYLGPLPKSKETAVVMIVDGIEAASRALKDKTHAKITSLVNSMVDHKIEENQLDKSGLTFHDIAVVRETLIEKLMNIYHVRIEYPEEKKA